MRGSTHPPDGVVSRVKLRASSSSPSLRAKPLGYRLLELLERVELAWLIISGAKPWYRGGLRGWAGASGRMDIVARVLLAACYEGCRPQREVAALVSLSDTALLVYEPVELRECSERGIGEHLLEALRSIDPARLIPGLSWREALAFAEAAGLQPIVLLEGCGRVERLGGRLLLVLGADIDPPRGLASAYECVSVGPLSYLASTVVYVVKSMLEPGD